MAIFPSAFNTPYANLTTTENLLSTVKTIYDHNFLDFMSRPFQTLSGAGGMLFLTFYVTDMVITKATLKYKHF